MTGIPTQRYPLLEGEVCGPRCPTPTTKATKAITATIRRQDKTKGSRHADICRAQGRTLSLR